jgi:hypothetical protein
MLSPDRQVIVMGSLRDQLVALMHDHENTAHGGKPCAGNRASAVAYLAHCLGVRGELWDYAHTLLEEYDANCKGDNCEHDALEEEEPSGG